MRNHWRETLLWCVQRKCPSTFSPVALTLRGLPLFWPDDDVIQYALISAQTHGGAKHPACRAQKASPVEFDSISWETHMMDRAVQQGEAQEILQPSCPMPYAVYATVAALRATLICMKWALLRPAERPSRRRRRRRSRFHEYPTAKIG